MQIISMQLCGGMSPSPAHLSTCRPVSCSTSQALPLEPGFVNSTIYQDQLGSGWGVGGSAVKWLQQSGAGLNKSNAACFDLPKAEVCNPITMANTYYQDPRPTLPLLLALPCPALPRPAPPRPPRPAPPCPALPCPALPCPDLPCPALPCPASPCLTNPCPSLHCIALRGPDELMQLLHVGCHIVSLSRAL